jgi:beta-galactosidase
MASSLRRGVFQFGILVCSLLCWAVIGSNCCAATEPKPAAKIYVLDARDLHKEILEGHLKMGSAGNPAGETITANNLYLMRDGKPWLPVMGEIHYSRYPRHMWKDALLKAKSGGVDIIATYVFWNHHEELQGHFDWSGRRDLRAFLELCQELGFPVLMRIGPWCHGEVRNGGFPDWVEKLPGKRSDDPQYLGFVERWYREIYGQCEGMLFKDGGPIIGIQLENEFSGPPQHIVTLKRLARRVGFDVPLYTETGWGVEVPEDEVIPVHGGYPDAPWTYGTYQLPPDEQYLFQQSVPVDTGIGTDVLPANSSPIAKKHETSRYPLLLAELGMGNQVYRTRRPIVTRQDAISLLLVKLAGGANLIGYYIYHGGTNPMGKLGPLEEPGYPELSYDFQTAISEFGETNDKYRQSKLVHYWLQDFGSELATMLPVMPQRVPSGPQDVDTLRFMARVKGRSGYLFFSNYQRYVDDRDVGPQQITVQLDGEALTLPSHPFTMPKDATAVWPLNLQLNGAELNWSTTQLICHVPTPTGEAYFFVANDDIEPEYVFGKDSIRVVDATSGTVSTESNRTMVSGINPGLDSVIRVKTSTGATIRICTLKYSEAMNLYRFRDLWGQPRVVVADADVLCDGKQIDVRRIGQPCNEIWICPGLAAVAYENQCAKQNTVGMFSEYSWQQRQLKVDLGVALSQVSEQPAKWEITIPPNVLDDVYDVFLGIDYVGDIARIRVGGELLADHYYYGPEWRPSLRHWKEKALGKTLELTITPITPDTWCYLEPEARPDFSQSESIAQIRAFSVQPQYRTILRLDETNAKRTQ